MAARTTPPDLPGFTYLGELGSGGFADVFRYLDQFDRRVAVKVQHRGIDGGVSADFQAEANLMAKLSSHPSIVTVYQGGVAADGRPFLVMEECATAHLGARIGRRPLTASKAMEITVQVAGAVETAHRMGILHRDIKPANILFTGAQRPALTDFGISASAQHVTANSALSPHWAPWEQYPDSGLAMGPWSDVFSLAATTWAMLVGRSPLVVAHGDNDRLSIRHRVRTLNVPRTGRHDVPELLERVLATALAADPQQRYQSALEFARAIQGVQGQLNESVTPIDVLSDSDDYADDEPELAETGTRVSGFMLIDPDQVEDWSGTSRITGPSGGVTSPQDDSWRQYDAAPQGPIGAPVAQHGRGFGQPGLRDFTGPAIPEPADQTVLDRPSQQPPPAERRTSRRWGPLAAVLAAVAVVLAGGLALGGLWLSGALGEATAGTQATVSPEASPAAQDPLALRVPSVEDADGQVADGQVTFTWTNPDPMAGDKYLVEELSLADAAPLQVVEAPSVTVPAQAGQTCVDVTLRRASGTTSAAVKICDKS